MAVSPKLKALVEAMPDPDGRGTYANIDKEKVEKAVAGIRTGGRENVSGLIDMLVEPGRGNDVKAHYALHALAVHVCTLKDEKARTEFARTVASRLADRPAEVQRFLIRQLQVAGGEEAVKTLGKALLDAALCDWAARALVAIGGSAADRLRDALPQVKGKCRLMILLALGALADTKAVSAFRTAVAGTDPGTQLAGAWGLARLADADSADALLKAADARSGWERIRLTDACFLLAENLAAAGKKAPAARIYTHLRDTRTRPSEVHVRKAAERRLAIAT